MTQITHQLVCSTPYLNVFLKGEVPCYYYVPLSPETEPLPWHIPKALIENKPTCLHDSLVKVFISRDVEGV